MTKEEFIALDDAVAHRKASALWREVSVMDWLSFSNVRDEQGKINIKSFFAEGPFVFIDRKKGAGVVSEMFFCQGDDHQRETISTRPIAQEAHRMFACGVSLELIKRQWGDKGSSTVNANLLSEATRYQLFRKQKSLVNGSVKAEAKQADTNDNNSVLF